MIDLPKYDIIEQMRQDREKVLKTANAVIFDGAKFADNWSKLAFEPPPDGFFERIWWSISVLGQLILSGMTFPAALGSFLMEEAVQTYGMGAYMLSTAGEYEQLETYIIGWKRFMKDTVPAAKTLAFMSPITGGAVLIYLEAAEASMLAFEAANDRKLLEQAEKDADIRRKLLDKQKYGRLRLQSSPSGASIFMNGEDIELLTPETFPELEPGGYTFLLKKYSAARDIEETVRFNVRIEAGRKKEIYVRIPKIIDGVTEDTTAPGESDDPQLPKYIRAEVIGEYAIDGDTFITTTGERIRILGIDAPEIGRPWADESREALTILVEDKKISLRIQSHKPLDTYSRTLAICNSWKGDIAMFQLSSGLARVLEFDDDLFDYTKYYSAEQIAKDRGIGIWS